MLIWETNGALVCIYVCMYIYFKVWYHFSLYKFYYNLIQQHMDITAHIFCLCQEPVSLLMVLFFLHRFIWSNDFLPLLMQRACWKLIHSLETEQGKSSSSAFSIRPFGHTQGVSPLDVRYEHECVTNALIHRWRNRSPGQEGFHVNLSMCSGLRNRERDPCALKFMWWIKELLLHLFNIPAWIILLVTLRQHLWVNDYFIFSTALISICLIMLLVCKPVKLYEIRHLDSVNH